MAGSLENRIALVTGGGSGIGLTFVRQIHAAGCKILIADLALHPTATSWLDSLSDKSSIFFNKTDVTDWKQLEGAFDTCVDRFGTPTIVVPAAGVYEPSSNSFWKDCDPDSHYKVLDINLNHPIKVTRIAIRHLTQAKQGGHIIHVSSIAGQRSSVVTPLYTAAKHGLNSFIRGMATLHELVNIKVCGVAPGTVGTPLFTEHPEASKYLDMAKDYLLPPQAVSNAMFALLTEEKYRSGTVLEVCDVEHWREVGLLNDPGPSGPASKTSKKHEALRDIIPFLQVEGAADLEKTMIVTD
ncbi:hypothetical protein G7046_g207 [Stylonectria norvegica]|nr:hypothetical protein G7046_g207 [Stylonectria norvegica]